MKSISKQRLAAIFNDLKLEELRPYVGDVVWDGVRSIEKSIITSGMIDISLDVESEEDSLFLLSNGLMVLNCAGQGDVGYFNRWTMEVHNRGDFHIPLVVGRRIAQISFYEVGPTKREYGRGNKYQDGSDLDELVRSWTPEMMLPRLHMDRELKGGR